MLEKLHLKSHCFSLIIQLFADNKRNHMANLLPHKNIICFPSLLPNIHKNVFTSNNYHVETYTNHMTSHTHNIQYSSVPWKFWVLIIDTTHKTITNIQFFTKRMRDQIYYNRLEKIFLFAFDNKLVSDQISAQS